MYFEEEEVSEQTESGLRRRGRPASTDKSVPSQEQQLQAALILFAEKGYAGTSVRELSRALGVSHTLLRQQYGSKEQLWETAVEFGFERILTSSLERLTAMQHDTLPPEQRLREAWVEMLLALTQTPELLYIANQEGVKNSPRLTHVLDKLHKNIAELKQLYDPEVAAGRLKPIPFGELYLMLLHGGGAVLCLRPLGAYLNLPEKRTDSELRAQAERIADILMSGVSA